MFAMKEKVSLYRYICFRINSKSFPWTGVAYVAYKERTFQFFGNVRLPILGHSLDKLYNWVNHVPTGRAKKLIPLVQCNICTSGITFLAHPVRHCSCRLPTWKKSRLNWKLTVSNTADNAGITQSQALYSRYRRMQELNSLCVSKEVNSCVTCRVHLWDRGKRSD